MPQMKACSAGSVNATITFSLIPASVITCAQSASSSDAQVCSTHAVAQASRSSRRPSVCRVLNSSCMHDSKSFTALSGMKARNSIVFDDPRSIGIVMLRLASESEHMSLSCISRFPSFTSPTMV
jgi:hypothetical protein